jgi:archaeosine-15-forming tRNA-guanine transglycosylase
VRRLWGRDKGGNFRSHGRHSHATVRGTRWLTVDRCDGTFTRVTDGAVVVRDFRRHRNVLVRAGHSYLARAHRR